MRTRNRVCLIASLILAGPFLLSLPLHSAAGQSLFKEQQKCINENNKNFAKVAKVQGGQTRLCIQNFAKGKNASAETCLAGNLSDKVRKATDRTLEKVSAKCANQMPVFGIADTSGATAADSAIEKEVAIVHEIFGSDLDAVIAALEGATKDASKCQLALLKAAQKCQDTKLKEFNKCKKIGLKGTDNPDKVPDPSQSPFDDPSDLAQCMGFDPKGKIAKICSTKLSQAIAKKCANQNTDGLFPGCAQQDLATCVDRIVECQVCLSLNTVDGLARDCDLFDDGAANGSCGVIEPFCGDGVVNAQEDCDPPDDTACPGLCRIDCTCPVCDLDGDGFLRPSCGGSDCDDGDPDIHPGAAEICDGADNDCDGIVDEGNPGGGAPCSSGLPGVCAAATLTCANGILVCQPDTLASPETCDGLDNDCDGTTDEGNPEGGGACNSGLPGVCGAGTLSCASGALVCQQDMFPSPETCDGLDNDCDGVSDEGNPGGGGSCNSGIPGVCAAGTLACTNGALVCLQNLSPSSETCNGLDDDCDGQIDENFNRNDNPLCLGAQVNLGQVSGDTGAYVLTDSYWNEEWERFRITEDNNGIAYLSATVRLFSPQGTDFDLYVYCASCGGALAGSSSNGSGQWDVVNVRKNDQWTISDDFNVIVEIRHFSSSICANWQLQVTGNTSVNNATCN